MILPYEFWVYYPESGGLPLIFHSFFKPAAMSLKGFLRNLAHHLNDEFATARIREYARSRMRKSPRP
ncbi:hypothetical protein EBAPG3_012400 [Nitrosospira lacus]|uniref:Uncharacterized protein n=1 Tax=Nitrosospira lacus TaxID=1288494 RepID=A0A1W6SRU6_9PROT|nr:hypothetical protein [Nitrosospira lacus]ARO88506.1 hypothetical protein EBAPG3_012400 [Nitrosospira lacus]